MTYDQEIIPVIRPNENFGFMGLYNDSDDHEHIWIGSLLPFKWQFEGWEENNKGMC